MSRPSKAPAATFVVFGAMGDLTKRLLAPALANLAKAGLLDDATRLVGVSHHEASDDDLRKALSEFLVDKPGHAWLAERTSYFKGDFNDAKTFEAIGKLELKNAVFYLATAPSFFGSIVDKLGEAGLLKGDNGFRRVVIEKPFGSDLASAQALNKQILARTSEERIYRIDHFLGKETVQNLMILRFGNPMFEAVWNSRYVDHIQITAAETVGVGSRGKFYDAAGALRDMVPNHLFQLMALVGMEPPNSFSAEAIRTEKAKLVAAVREIAPEDAVRGQYGAGEAGGKPLEPYVKSADVDPKSRTETYAALKVLVDTWRWSGTPFYLRTGKALKARDTEIVIQFRDVALALFKSSDAAPLAPNRMVLQIQPDEGVSVGFSVKTPGPALEATPAEMAFRYADRFDLTGRTGYETLLYDVLIGDQTLFQRADQIEGGWRAIAKVQAAWSKGEPEVYATGAEGPRGSASLLARDGRAWHPIG